MNRSPAVILVMLSVAVAAAAQTSWHTLTSNNGEFSLTVPADYKVYNNKRGNTVNVFGSGDGAYFDASFQKTSDGNESMDSLRKSASKSADQTEFKIGEADVYLYKLKDKNAFLYSVYVATPKGYYRVTTTSKDANSPTLASMLASIRLNRDQLLKTVGGQDPTASATIKVGSLKSSDVIRSALQRKQYGQIQVVEGADEPLRERDVVYSRRPIVLEKPAGRYTEEARNSGVKGAVKLRVLLKADGNLGRITVVTGLPSGLTEEAVRAASLIKFLPAEILGVPVDREITVEYTFTYF